MPTYQDAPMYPLIFPDMAVSKNLYGFKALKGNKFHHADLLPAGDSYHPEWRTESEEAVMDRLTTNRIKDKQIVKGPPSIKGSKYTTQRGIAALRGGVVQTKEGERMLQTLLQNRVRDLDMLGQLSFETEGQVPPARDRAVQPDMFELDSLFSELYTALDEGYLTKSLLSTSSKIMAYFLTKGDTIPDHKYAEYNGVLTELYQLVEAIIDGELSVYEQRAPDTEHRKMKKILEKLLVEILDLQSFIEAFMSYLGQPTKAKKARLDAIRSHLLVSARQRVQPLLERALDAQEEALFSTEETPAFRTVPVYPGAASSYA
jgi:hypothetical protein